MWPVVAVVLCGSEAMRVSIANSRSRRIKYLQFDESLRSVPYDRPLMTPVGEDHQQEPLLRPGRRQGAVQTSGSYDRVGLVDVFFGA